MMFYIDILFYLAIAWSVSLAIASIALLLSRNSVNQCLLRVSEISIQASFVIGVIGSFAALVLVLYALGGGR